MTLSETGDHHVDRRRASEAGGSTSRGIMRLQAELEAQKQRRDDENHPADGSESCGHSRSRDAQLFDDAQIRRKLALARLRRSRAWVGADGARAARRASSPAAATFSGASSDGGSASRGGRLRPSRLGRALDFTEASFVSRLARRGRLRCPGAPACCGRLAVTLGGDLAGTSSGQIIPFMSSPHPRRRGRRWRSTEGGTRTGAG